MTLPKPHSCTWSDDEQRLAGTREGATPGAMGPESLKDKELYLWVTYPEEESGRKTAHRRHRRRRGPVPKLWAVMIIERVCQTAPFRYEVALRRVFKHSERWIRIWVANDPNDQSDDAAVLGFISPNPKDLSPLEQYLTQMAARRVYDAIAETWAASHAPG